MAPAKQSNVPSIAAEVAVDPASPLRLAHRQEQNRDLPDRESAAAMEPKLMHRRYPRHLGMLRGRRRRAPMPWLRHRLPMAPAMSGGPGRRSSTAQGSKSGKPPPASAAAMPAGQVVPPECR